MNGMHTNRHHIGLSFCVKALSKGRYGSSLTGMDACRNKKLLDQGYKSLNTSPELSLTGFSLMVLAPLPDTMAALILSLCALSQAATHSNRPKSHLGVGGGCWAHGSGEQERESPGVQEHGGQSSKSPVAMFLAFS
eukprot:1144741-Pelagomonas_calceolata.AAC.3